MQVHISEAKFRVFHIIDRILYMILVTDLLCNPNDAMKIMAFWLWLELMDFLNVIRRIMLFPIHLVSALVDEANVCLKFINNPQLPLTNEYNDIHFTKNFIHGFSLQYLQTNQTLENFGVEIVQTKIYLLAFSDLLEQAIIKSET